jgi:hypothetical protein
MVVLVCESKLQRCGFIARLLLALPEQTAMMLWLKAKVLEVESDAKNAIDVTVVRNDIDMPGSFYRSFDNTACLTHPSNVRLEEVNLPKTFYSQTRQCHIREDSDI